MILILCFLNLFLKAYQTFEVLCKIGCKHDLSAGLIIGGKASQISQQFNYSNTRVSKR